MQIDKYAKTLICIIAGLLLMGGALSYILFTSGPRVRHVQFSRSPSTSSLLNGSLLTLTFDRPIQQGDYSKLITFSPELPFTTKTTTQNITIQLQANPKHDTEYILSLSPDIYDVSDKKMKDPYTYSFVTAKPRFAYIERNYDTTPASNIYVDTTDDHLMLASLGSSPEIVFSHPKISTFQVSEKYAVVSVEEETQDALYTINLENKQARREKLEFDGRITNLALGAQGTAALFTVEPLYNTVSNEFYDQFAKRVESLNLETGLTTPLLDSKEEYIKANELWVDTAGQVAVAQDQTQVYYAVSPYGDYEPTRIGSFTTSFGFSDTGTELFFRDKTDLLRYDIKTGDISTIDARTDGYKQHIALTNRQILLSASEYLDGDSLGKIYTLSAWDSKPTELWSEVFRDDQNLQGFKQSYDARMVAIYKTPKDCQYDSYMTNSVCKSPETYIYNIDSNSNSYQFRGFNLLWLP